MLSVALQYDESTPYGRVMALLSQRGRVQRLTRGVLTVCPAHADGTPSLKVEQGDDGRVLLHCKAGCDLDSIVSALGITARDLFPHDGVVTELRPRERLPTLAELAAHKHLPEAFLASLGWRDGRRGVEIPYRQRDGAVHRVRLRSALSGTKGSLWAPGEGTIAYEPDGGALARQERYLVMVEGETDTATLLYAGFPALGAPGADSAGKVLEAHHLEGIERVYYVREPDKGGDRFAELIPPRLAELEFSGPVHELRMPGAAKDPSALWQRDPAAFPGLLSDALRLASAPKWRWLHEAIPSALKPVGERFSTGFATLDDALRGGVPLGRVVMLLGAPGAAKTTLAAYLADRWERAGAAVVFLAVDEPAEGIILRLGQLSGWSRESLEEEGDASDAVRAGFAKRSEGRRLVVLDPDEHGMSIEDAAQALQEAGKDRPRVLMLDSLQTARCAAAAGVDSSIERMDAVVHTLKRIARTGVLVLAISEMSRAGYRGDAGQVSALSAGKGSGSIEYGGSLVLALQSVKGEAGQVDVEVAKNRIRGAKPKLRLQLDFERASFTEIINDSTVPEGSRNQLDKQIEMVVQALLKTRKPISTKTQLALSVDLRRKAAFEAVSMAIHEGRIAFVDGQYIVVNHSKEGV